MPVAIDVANLGEAAIDSAGTTIACTTGATAAAGSTIILTGSSIQPVVASSVAGGGLTWSVDKTGNDGVACAAWICSAYAASGLASGTTITVTLSASSAGGRSVAATSFTRIPSASRLDTTSGPTNFSATTAWTSASTSIAAGSVLIAVGNDFTDQRTSTVTAPSLEAHDFGTGSPGGFSTTTCYRIETSAASYTVAGAWAASATGTVVAAAYKWDGTAAAAEVQGPLFQPIPFMSNQRI